MVADFCHCSPIMNLNVMAHVKQRARGWTALWCGVLGGALCGEWMLLST